MEIICCFHPVVHYIYLLGHYITLVYIIQYSNNETEFCDSSDFCDF